MGTNYWQERDIVALDKITERSVKDTEKLLSKSYLNSSKKVLKEFAETYEKLLNTIEEGREPTPADLYKLDKYWQMSASINEELQKLGVAQEAILSKQFLKEFEDIYRAISFKEDRAFSTIDREGMVKAINSIWCADGKTWSSRVWNNISQLNETLSDEFIHCVITGKKTSELKKQLQERFNVSYSQADTLVRTEMAYIQTSAAAKRYQEYGLTHYEFLGREEHDIGCKCKQLNGEKFRYTEMVIGQNAPPLHPRCRCSIIPVVE